MPSVDQLVPLVLRASQSSTDDVEAVSLTVSALNEAYMQVASSGVDWDFLRFEGDWNVAGGTDSVPLATVASAINAPAKHTVDVLSMMHTDSHGGHLDGLGWDALERLTGSTATMISGQITGRPSVWSQWAGMLRLAPVPDSSFVLRVLVSLRPSGAQFTGTDEFLLPPGFHESLLVPYAASVVLEAEGGSEALNAANRLLSRYQEGYQRLVAASGGNRRESFTVLEPGAFRVFDDVFDGE